MYSQSVHAPARDAGLMDNDAERYCNTLNLNCISQDYLDIEDNDTHLACKNMKI